MKTFDATKVTDKSIELTACKDIEELYKTIKNNENFILNWTEGTVQRSELIISDNLASKVTNGDIKLTSQQKEGK